MAVNRGKYKILVIEDNPGDFTLVEDFLFEQIDAPVITHTTTFVAASDILSGNCGLFDIILLDLSLPDKTGEPLIHEIIDKSNNAPVIVLTGYTDFAFGAKSLSLGVADYILKDDLTSMALYKSIIYSLERKKSIAELKESEKRYSDIFHFSPLPMLIVDVDTLKFLDVNKATIDHYGYTHEEFLTMTIKDIRPPEDVPATIKIFEETKKHPDEIASVITTHKKKDGDLIKVEVQFAQFKYKGIKSNIVVVNDLTQRLNYISAIEEQNKKLQEISWIQSHIVRAPLTRIMGLVPLLTREFKENGDEKEKMLEYLSSSANELDETIKNITEKTRIEDYDDFK